MNVCIHHPRHEELSKRYGGGRGRKGERKGGRKGRREGGRESKEGREGDREGRKGKLTTASTPALTAHIQTTDITKC